MGVLVLLEMDGSTEAVLAAAVDLEARRPTSAKLAQVGLLDSVTEMRSRVFEDAELKLA